MQKIKKYKWLVGSILHTSLEEKKRLIAGFKGRKKYYTMEGIDANLKEMAKCANCPNMCRFDCPALQMSRRETYSPANKVRIAYFMGMDRVPMDNASAIKALYACMGCDACQHWCPMDISAGELLVEMRHELEKRSIVPESMNNLKSNIEKTNSIFDESPYKADSEFNINMPNPEVFYYIGCMSLKHRPNSVKAHIAILKAMGISFCTRLDKRVCCGSPVYEAGWKSVTQKLSVQNQSVISESTAKIVISDCPGCIKTLKMTYPTLGQSLTPKVMHSSEYFLEQINAGRLVPKTSVKKSVTLHDPCIIARKFEQPEILKNILAKIPGLEIKDAYLHGDEAQCCGYGSVYHVSNPEFSMAEGDKRFEQLQKHQPNYIASACPTCEYAICKAQERAKSKKEEIKDYAEILADSLGLTL